MTENNFWEILDKLDWTHEGDDEKVMEPHTCPNMEGSMNNV